MGFSFSLKGYHISSQLIAQSSWLLVLLEEDCSVNVSPGARKMFRLFTNSWLLLPLGVSNARICTPAVAVTVDVEYCITLVLALIAVYVRE
ncbi:MAG TPA: hypothetical protein VHT34_11560, partial [Clostridia bacterium]|nr:hypothetical protein [Clostridia bacterium]